MKRKSKGLVFLTLGVLLLFSALGWYLYNVIEDETAGRKAAEIIEKFEFVQSPKESLELPKLSLEASPEAPTVPENTKAKDPVIIIDSEAFCGRIRIKKLGIELPVYDQWDYKKLKNAPCRYLGSVSEKDIIIAGHNYKSHFGTLDKLKIGDEVEFWDAYGELYLYQVCDIVTLDGTAVSDMQSGGWDFTLFTCTKSGEQRVTVRCEMK